MRKVFLVVLGVILLFSSGCTSNSAPDSSDKYISEDNILELRQEYFDFAIENRLDYVPIFDEGEAPSSSAEYLFYAFVTNLENWGSEKGIMTRDYVEEVIQTHFKVGDITHEPMDRGWKYDGVQYTAIPQGINGDPIYVLQDFKTYTQNNKTIYEITLDYCTYGDVIPNDEDMDNIRKNIVSDDLSGLKVLQTERFKYYLDQPTDKVVFVAHTLVEK